MGTKVVLVSVAVVEAVSVIMEMIVSVLRVTEVRMVVVTSWLDREVVAPCSGLTIAIANTKERITKTTIKKAKNNSCLP